MQGRYLDLRISICVERGYAVLREGEVASALRLYEPEWVATQEEVGEILGLAIQPGGRPGTRGEEGEPRG